MRKAERQVNAGNGGRAWWVDSQPLLLARCTVNCKVAEKATNLKAKGRIQTAET
jgi:hypothetical protein